MWDVPIHEGINRSDNLHREGMHHKRIKEKKSDYDKFNNQRSGGGTQSIATGAMDKGLPPKPRI